VKSMLGRLAGAVLLWSAIGVACAQPAGERIAGNVTAVEGDDLVIKGQTGAATRVHLGKDTRVSVRAPISVSQLQPGMYVAITSVPQADGTLLASELRVFPESQRGLAEGHRPMSGQPGSTMTNATISNIASAGSTPRNSVTNATITAYSAAEGGRRLTVTYKDGEKVVLLPDNVPVMLTEIGDRALLKPGAHVVAYATRAADGGWTSERVSVGKGDFVPPS
jgi:hypothetical protein